MDVHMLFILFIMGIALFYLLFRIYTKKAILSFAAVIIQAASLAFALYIYIENVQSDPIIKAGYITAGILIPTGYAVYDLLHFKRRLRENSIYLRFIPKRASAYPLANNLAEIRPDDFDASPEVEAGHVQKSILQEDSELMRNLGAVLFQAHTAIHKRDYETAFHTYEVLARLFKDNGLIGYNRGILCLKTGRFSEAAGHFNKSAAVSEPSDIHDTDTKYLSYLNKGHAMYRSGDYIEAEAAYSRASDTDPDAYEAVYLIGRALAADGRYAVAEVFLQRAVKMASHNSSAYFILGMMMKYEGNIEKAGEYLKSSVSSDPLFKDAYMELVKIEISKENPEKASEYCDKLLEIDRTDAMANFLKGCVMYKKGSYSQAVDNYRKARDIDPLNYKYWHNLAVGLEELGRTSEAETSYRKAMALKPDRYDSFNSLGVMLCKAGRYKDSLIVYDEGLKNNPGSYKLYYNKGMAHSLAEEEDKAAGCYIEAISLNREDLMLYYYLGSSYLRLRKYREAIEAFKRALTVDASNSELLYMLAEAYAVNKEYRIAIETLKKAVEIDQGIVGRALENNAFMQLRRLDSFADVMPL